MPKIQENKMKITIPITIQIKAALAQFALLGLVPLLKAQTNSIMIPTIGIAEINIVTTQSPVVTAG